MLAISIKADKGSCDQMHLFCDWVTQLTEHTAACAYTPVVDAGKYSCKNISDICPQPSAPVT